MAKIDTRSKDGNNQFPEPGIVRANLRIRRGRFGQIQVLTIVVHIGDL